MGYIIVGARIDPHDWGEINGGAPPPAETIVQRVLSDRSGQGQYHLDARRRRRPQPHRRRVAANYRWAPRQGLRVRFRFRSPRADSRAGDAPSDPHEWLLARADAFIFDVFRWFRAVIAFIFIAGILLVSGRALIIGLLALIEKLRPAPKTIRITSRRLRS